MRFQKAVLAATILSVMGATAYADGVRTEVQGNTVTVTAFAEGKKKANIFVSRKGQTDNANIYEMIELTANENGKLVHSFTIPESRNGISSYGEYEVLVKPEGAELLTGSFAYATSEDLINLMNALKANGADFSAMFSKDSEWRTALKAMGCLMEEYDKLSDPSAAVKSFQESFTAEKSQEETKRIFNTSVLMQQITDVKTAGEVLEQDSPAFDGKRYFEEDEETKKWIAARMPEYRPYTSVNDFETKYQKICALHRVNQAKFDKLAETLNTYQTVLELSDSTDYKTYTALSETKKNAANEKLAAALHTAPATTAAALKQSLKSAIETGKTTGGGGGGGTGSGSGGSGGSGIISPGPTVITPVTDPDQTDADFTDLDSVEWAKEAILALKEQRIVSGKGNGEFAPHDQVTREEFTAMIVKAAGLYQPGETVEFDDITKDDWCYPFVASGFNHKLIYGISETSFGKGTPITRQDMTVIAYRAAKDSGRIHYGREMQNFRDAEEISGYAKEAVEALYKAGMVNGSDGYFYPQNTATRAEAAVILYQLFVK